jgi:DNA-binding response OmpR family regulator
LPALTALVVYLRPLQRAGVLSTLADLGIFVVEHQGAEGVIEIGQAAFADLALLVAAERGHEEVARLMTKKLTPVVVVSLPAGADPAPYLAAGAMACVTDEALTAGVAEAVVDAANRARRLRPRTGPNGSKNGSGVFGGLSFSPAQSTLGNGGRTLALARSEREVLLRLAAAHGKPVARQELERGAASSGPIHPGLLKAVVLRIRRKAAALGADPELLGTIRGYGYRLSG